MSIPSSRRPGLRSIPLRGLPLRGLVAGLPLVLAACAPGASPSEQPQAARGPVPWVRLGTADAHSLAFAPGDLGHVFFGHHGGILESLDAGRAWQPLGARADAMSMDVGDGTTLYIAGHDVFQVSRDEGRTWSQLDADLPDLDIHGFARDPADRLRMWAYLARGGVYESTDGGTSWGKVYEGHVPFVTAVDAEARTRLLGLDPTAGIIQSDDAGRSWTVVSTPPASPVVSLAATPDGRTVLLGAGDGLYRSDDGGVTWRLILAVDLPLAIAVSEDGTVVAAVTRATDFYRSDDGGASWPGP